MHKIIGFDADILKGLKLKNPDLMAAFVCLSLAAGADGVAAMTAPGPLAHIKHKRRAGMISALVVAGLVKRAPGGYLVHGVGSGPTDDGQTEDTEPTAAREASHCNTSQDNSGWTAVQQRGGGGDIEALENLLDTMATKETIVNPEEITIEGRALALARRSWEIMPDSVKARVEHDFESYWQQSKLQHMRTASNA